MTLSLDCQKALKQGISAPPGVKLASFSLTVRSILKDRHGFAWPFEPTMDNFALLFCYTWFLVVFTFFAFHFSRFLFELQKSKGWWVLRSHSEVVELGLSTEQDLSRFDKLSLWSKLRLMIFHHEDAKRREKMKESVPREPLLREEHAAVSTGVTAEDVPRNRKKQTPSTFAGPRDE